MNPHSARERPVPGVSSKPSRRRFREHFDGQRLRACPPASAPAVRRVAGALGSRRQPKGALLRGAGRRVRRLRPRRAPAPGRRRWWRGDLRPGWAGRRQERSHARVHGCGGGALHARTALGSRGRSSGYAGAPARRRGVRGARAPSGAHPPGRYALRGGGRRRTHGRCRAARAARVVGARRRHHRGSRSPGAQHRRQQHARRVPARARGVPRRARRAICRRGAERPAARGGRDRRALERARRHRFVARLRRSGRHRGGAGAERWPVAATRGAGGGTPRTVPRGGPRVAGTGVRRLLRAGVATATVG